MLRHVFTVAVVLILMSGAALGCNSPIPSPTPSPTPSPSYSPQTSAEDSFLGRWVSPNGDSSVEIVSGPYAYWTVAGAQLESISDWTIDGNTMTHEWTFDEIATISEMTPEDVVAADISENALVLTVDQAADTLQADCSLVVYGRQFGWTDSYVLDVSQQGPVEPEPSETLPPLDNALIGTWIEDTWGSDIGVLAFNADGTYTERAVFSGSMISGTSEERGNYSLIGDSILLTDVLLSWDPDPSTPTKKIGYVDRPEADRHCSYRLTDSGATLVITEGGSERSYHHEQ